MKLYATITSERATKGQGGKYLDIEIMGDNKMVIARIKVSSSYPYQYDMDVFPVVYPEFSQGSAYKLNLDVKGHSYKLTRKAKRQKGDKSHGLHNTCMYDHDHNSGNCEYHD